MGSRNGIEKVAARKAGVTIEEWQSRRARGERWCYCCKTWRPSIEFGKDKSRTDGLASACKTCANHKVTATRYKIDIDLARGLRSGLAVCEICGRKQKLEVDHNHSTGKVRGVLCSRCNGALGQFLDDINMLKKAIAYLEKNDG